MPILELRSDVLACPAGRAVLTAGEQKASRFSAYDTSCSSALGCCSRIVSASVSAVKRHVMRFGSTSMPEQGGPKVRTAPRGQLNGVYTGPVIPAGQAACAREWHEH